MFETPQRDNHQDLRHRIDMMQRVRVDDRDFSTSPEKIMQAAVERTFPQLGYQETKQLAREVVLTPRNKSVRVNGHDIPVEELQYQIGENIEFHVAESIENVNSETSSSEEYYRWIEDGVKVIHDMNDGFVSEDDLKAKETLVGDLNQREADIMVCLGLYEASGTPKAKERYDQLRNKLNKLREIRSAVNNTTKNRTDVEKEPNTTPEETRKADYYAASLMVLDRLTVDDKKKLGMDHSNDFVGYSFGNKLMFDYQYSSRSSYAESFVMNKKSGLTTTKDELRKKLEILSGRKTLTNAPYKDVNKEARDKFVENIRNKRFDGVRFLGLNSQEGR